MAFMRPSPMLAQYATPLEGLYLCGAGTHPGGGVMAASGHNAAQRILKDRRRKGGLRGAALAPQGDRLATRALADGPVPAALPCRVLPVAISNGEVILIVVLLVAPIAAIAFAGSGAVYREIGKGGVLDGPRRDRPRRGPRTRRWAEPRSRPRSARCSRPRPSGNASAARRRSTSRPRCSRLSAPAAVDLKADPALVDEVRQLVVARNARRERQGKEPLDVEAEVARQLRDLESLGQ